eukprot:TRINITY_DN5776_c0_g1_i1.p3 TRINITY_DN5776_c0_g1~~TRINITY_DN5776_c0_g1_i1.p3  ORF type:complete len:92 (-),score=16.98 TRINITY_DN5776_c0_g1_i1:510-785(-)
MEKLEGMSSSLGVGADGTICTVSASAGLVFFREATASHFTQLKGIDNVKHVSVGSRIHVVSTKEMVMCFLGWGKSLDKTRGTACAPMCHWT